MPLSGDILKNPDKTENCHITGFETLENGSIVSATGFVNDYRKEFDPMLPKAPQFSNAGVSLGVENSVGSLALTGTHMPKAANVVTASTNVNLINTDVHKLTANTFATTVMPNAGSSFETFGGGVDYSYKNSVGAKASVSHTPNYKQTSYFMGGSLNVPQSSTSSFGVDLGANRTDSRIGKGSWEPQVSLYYKRTF